MPVNDGAPALKKFSAIKQRRLDLLLRKNSEGTISPGELILLKGLVREAERLMANNAKRLVAFAKRDGNPVPANSVPVTVWVTAAPTAK